MAFRSVISQLSAPESRAVVAKIVIPESNSRPTESDYLVAAQGLHV